MMDINLPRLAAILFHPLLPLRYLAHSPSLYRSISFRCWALAFLSLPSSNAFTVLHPLTDRRIYTVYPMHSDVDLREWHGVCVYRVCRLENRHLGNHGDA